MNYFTYDTFLHKANKRLLVRGSLILMPFYRQTILEMVTVTDGILCQVTCTAREEENAVYRPDVSFNESSCTEGSVKAIIKHWEEHSVPWVGVEEVVFGLRDEREFTKNLMLHPDAFFVYLGIAYGMSLNKYLPEHPFCVRLLGLIHRLKQDKIRVVGLPVAL